MTVVFIHGVTVRDRRYETLLTDVTAGIWKHRPGVVVAGVYWGDLAATLRFKGASIPGFIEGTTAFAGIDEDQIELVLTLLENPHHELELLTPPPDPQAPPKHLLPPLPRDQRLKTVRPSVAADLVTLVPRLLPSDVAVPAEQVTAIVDTAFAAATRTDHTLTSTQLIGPLTRCLTAGLYRLAVEPTDLSPQFRWNRVEGEVQSLLERHFKGAKGPLKTALAYGTTFALQRGLRRKLMAGLSIFVGDVARYMTHRDTILQRVEERLHEVVADPDEDLWIIGHSLGGVIAYEYCALGRRQVDRLVTVGSQVGLLAEMGAVQTHEGSGKFAMPPRTAYWLNLFDASDMLSFLAAPVFEGVEDIPVDTGAPFPAAHSEYWADDFVYATLARDV